MTKIKLLEAGALVTLRSGGPSLTVCDVDGSQITCCWFEGSRLKERVFPYACLKGTAEISEIRRVILDPKQGNLEEAQR